MHDRVYPDIVQFSNFRIFSIFFNKEHEKGKAENIASFYKYQISITKPTQQNKNLLQYKYI